MNTPLTPLLARFVESMNAHDTAAYLPCFASDAVVEDEGHTHRGPAEIKAWIEAAFVKYRPVLEVTEVSYSETGAVLSGPVSGTFDGSPVVLHYHLGLKDDRITRLRITP